MTLTAPTPAINYGEFFTRRWVVDVLLDITGYTADRDLGSLHLLEPSCGSGAFLGPAVERLISSARAYGHDLALLGDAVRAYDLQSKHVKTARQVCRDLLVAAGAPEDTATALAKTWVRRQDFLLPGVDDLPADVAIGNPPYIRYDDLDAGTAIEYRRTWRTMKGRGDIYVGFYERCLAMLKPGGRVGFICADRWMRNQYGEDLRDLVSSRYAVEHVWTMHDVDAFESEVSAYPAITVLANQPQGTAVVADATAAFGETSAQALAKWSRDESMTHFTDTGVRAHRLPHWFPAGEMWPTGSPARLALIERLNDGFASLHDEATGTRVAIGIATGADKAYVTKDAGVAESGRLLPLSMRRDLMSGSFEWQGNYLVNPWDAAGNLVDLADYPRLAAYLGAHPAIKDRFVAKKNPDRWHRTIDKVNTSIIDKPKLLLQDMKARIHPVLEPGGHYPHHNLYYVVSDMWDLEVLGGILLSRIAQAFIEAYCVRMRGGTLRFQAQYLKKIRVPSPTAIPSELADELRSAFRARDIEAATTAAARVYGIDLLEYELTDTVPTMSREDVEPLLVNWWKAKNEAAARLLADGKSDTGAQARDARHMQSISMFVRQMFVDAGLAESDVTVDGIVPGYYRRSKNWDVVAMHKGHLVGLVELKSQASSSGNNANNRIEEAIGSAVDAKAVQELTGAFGNLGVWTAWCMTFNRDAESGQPIRSRKSKIRIPLEDPAFKSMTYASQYAIALERLISQKVYDAGWMVLTWLNDDGTVDYVEPIPTATAETLATQIEARVKFAIQALRNE